MNTEQKDQNANLNAEEHDAAGEATYAEQTEAAEQTNASGVDDAVKQELEQAKKLADENYQRFLRAQADFDNYRRRTQKEKEDFAKYASQKVIEQLLPVVDNFERALAASKDNADALAKGVDMIFRQLEGVLTAEGLTPMEAVGQPFNPEFHQAVQQVESDEYEEGIVVEVLQKGYVLKDKVIRPAMVKVSS